MSSRVGSTKWNGIVRSWVVGSLGYAAAWLVAVLAIQAILSSGGVNVSGWWVLIIELVPGAVGAALAVAVLRVRTRPAWHVGLQACAGVIVVAAIVTAFACADVVSRTGAAPSPMALLLPLAVTVLVGLALGAFRARVWMPPSAGSAADSGYIATRSGGERS